MIDLYSNCVTLVWSPCYYITAGCKIRIYDECEVGIEKSVPRIIDWQHEACRVMTNGDPEGRIVLSHPHTNNVFFFLLTIRIAFCIGKKIKK